MDPVTGSAGYMISGNIAGGSVANIINWVTSGIGSLVDYKGALMVRDDFIAHGKPAYRYRYTYNGQWAKTALGKALDFASLVIMPVIEGINQYLTDLSNTNLEGWQRGERALIAFDMALYIAILAAAIVTPLMAILFPISPILAAIGVVVIAYIFNYFWKILKNDVFETYGLAMLTKAQNYA